MAPTIGATEQSTVRDSRHDDERSTEKFAAVFAGAMHNHAHVAKHAHVKPKDGTSELDAPDESAAHDDADKATTDSSAAAETKSASDAKAPSDAKAASDAKVPSDIKAKADAASATDAVVRSVSTLDPALQAKLARVMERMRDETGQDVKVSETYRSQSRQDALYAQGRQAPGPVVTWTQNSKHTQGRAVDVLLGGGNASPDAYATLQRIAKEEGLRTLGAIDPGHLELPSTGATSAANGATPAIPVAPADASGPGMVSIARLAQVAQVAQVATVAQPARVARVATVAPVNVNAVASNGAAASQSAVSQATVTQVAPNQATVNQTAPNQATVNQATVNQATVNQATVDASDDDISTGAQMSNRATIAQGPKAATPSMQGTHTQSAGAQSGSQKFGADSGHRGSDSGSGDGRGYGALDAAYSMREQTAASSALHGATPVTGVSTAERAARIMAMDDAPARPLSQITMNVDAGNGTTDRVQVGLRGSTLNATIDTVDISGARAMTARSDELVRALSRDGVEVESLRVRATATAAPVLAPQNSRSSSDSSNSARSERDNPWQQQDKQQSESDRRQQQRDKRGGNTQ
jgi:uncharacterized protein YcbK (DUF882 family)